MAEIFERKLPTTRVKWTGKRLTTGIEGRVEIQEACRVNGLSAKDYVSPGLELYKPDHAFPHMVIGDTDGVDWPFLRREVDHNWYVDRRDHRCGFLNRDEATLLYNSAKLFAGEDCLEIGCHRGWSTVHIAASAGLLDVIDPVLLDKAWVKDVEASFSRAEVRDRIVLHGGFSPDAVEQIAVTENRRWSFIFIDGDHEGTGPRKDAAVADRFAADTALILFHDLVAPEVAAGLDYLRNRGWNTMVYQTMQIMGAAWRGDVEPIRHIPDPDQYFVLPDHLATYRVSGADQTADYRRLARAAERALQRLSDRYVAMLGKFLKAITDAEGLHAQIAGAKAAHESAASVAKKVVAEANEQAQSYRHQIDELRRAAELALDEAVVARQQRDFIRLGAFRASAKAEGAWRTRALEAEQQATEWRERYQSLRAVLSNSGVYKISQLIPSGARRALLRRLLRGPPS